MEVRRRLDEDAWRQLRCYEEHQEEADAKLRRERDAGYLEWSEDLHDLERCVGKLRPARIAVLVKQTGEAKKVRIIHDLRRNGSNALVSFHERLVLPRLRDVINGAMDLLHGLQERSPTLSVSSQTRFKLYWTKHFRRRNQPIP